MAVSRVRLRGVLLITSTALALTAPAAVAAAPSPMSSANGRYVSLDIDGLGKVTVRLADLAMAETRLRSARNIADIPRALAGLDPALRAAAIWDRTHGLREETETSVTRSVAFGPCGSGDPEDCEHGVPTDSEPPVDPPSTKIPPPAPAPVCYMVVDHRTATDGIIIHQTAYKYWQHLQYCVSGQIIEQDASVYSEYTDVSSPWVCQFAQNDTNRTFFGRPDRIDVLSQGLCQYGISIVGVFNLDAPNGQPTIEDEYGLDGSRLHRAGKSH